MYFYKIQLKQKTMHQNPNAKTTFPSHQNSPTIAVFILIMNLLLVNSGIKCTQSFNTSACESFWLEGVYFHLNYRNDGQNLFAKELDSSVEYMYNLCNELEYYCEGTHEVVSGSLVGIFGRNGENANLHYKWECCAYQQTSIELVKRTDLSSGIKVRYTIKNADQVDPAKNINESITIQFPCASKNQVSAIDSYENSGCPHVQKSTIFDYLSKQQLAFTITCEILGLILMVLGVYIYRISIVLIGAFSLFAILLFIEVPIVFERGVSDEILGNVIILTFICSFFGGYVSAYFPKIGLFILGAWLGIILSLTLNNIAFYYIPSDPANLTLWIVMPILAVGFGLLGLFIKKTFIIFSTSLIGAYLCLRALSWHLGAFPNQFLFARKYQLGLEGPVEWQFYLYFISLLILTASSSALQYWLFNKKNQVSGNQIDLDQQFVKMEKDLIAKRVNLVEFEDIFKKKKSKGPKVLTKRKRSEIDDQYDQQNDDAQQNQEQQSSSSSEQATPPPPPKKSKGKIQSGSNKKIKF